MTYLNQPLIAQELIELVCVVRATLDSDPAFENGFAVPVDTVARLVNAPNSISMALIKLIKDGGYEEFNDMDIEVQFGTKPLEFEEGQFKATYLVPSIAFKALAVA